MNAVANDAGKNNGSALLIFTQPFARYEIFSLNVGLAVASI
jgi:hypothetical protein